MNNSPYLDRPLLPFAVALPRMLEKIDVALVVAGPAETQRLRQCSTSCSPEANPP